MDLKYLNTFIHVCELQSFTKAAEKLKYSQPTISFQIKQLEDELSKPLFERIGHTVTLTEAGRELLPYAQQMLRIHNKMIESDKKEKKKATVRMAMSDSLCSWLFSQHFNDFQKQYPNISLKIITAGTNEMFRLLHQNEVDIVCTLDNRFYDTSYVIRNEEKIEASFVTRFDSPVASIKNLTLERLLREPFLLTEKGMSYRRLLEERLAMRSLDVHPIFETGSADLILSLVCQGAGVSFLPDYVTQKAVEEKKAVRLTLPDFRVELWKQVLHHRDKWISDELESVLDWVAKKEL